MDRKNKCRTCKIILGITNKSGYCVKCYRKSSQYREYQRLYHKELRKNPKFIKYQTEYNRRPEVRRRKKIYGKKYLKEHIERIRELKRNWANKPENRLKRKEYLKEYRKKLKDFIKVTKLKGG